MLNNVDMVDLAVVMFYAPWDADSMNSREAFIEACEINKDEVIILNILLDNYSN